MGNQRNREVFEQSVACFRRALELDPNYAAPYAGLGMACMLDHQNHWSEKAETSLDEAQRFIAKSIARDDKDPYAYYVASLVAFWKRDLERSREEADKALSLNPNHPQALVARGNIEALFGRAGEGNPLLRKGDSPRPGPVRSTGISLPWPISSRVPRDRRGDFQRAHRAHAQYGSVARLPRLGPWPSGPARRGRRGLA